jgi:hypothetical protein
MKHAIWLQSCHYILLDICESTLVRHYLVNEDTTQLGFSIVIIRIMNCLPNLAHVLSLSNLATEYVFYR